MNDKKNVAVILASVLDWIRMLFEHASPSIYALLASTLPYLTPLPIAIMTASATEKFLGFNPQTAAIFVFCLEGLGVWFTVTLVHTVIDFIKSRNIKTGLMVFVFAISVVAYIRILLGINVRLDSALGNVGPEFLQVKTLMCYLPLLAGIANGYYQMTLNHKSEINEIKEREERHYQERRSDRKEFQRLKLGLNNTNQYPQDTYLSQAKEKFASDFKEYVMELLDQNQGKIELTEITRLVNKNKRVQLEHAKVKGTWHKFIAEWKRDHS